MEGQVWRRRLAANDDLTGSREVEKLTASGTYPGSSRFQSGNLLDFFHLRRPYIRYGPRAPPQRSPRYSGNVQRIQPLDGLNCFQTPKTDNAICGQPMASAWRADNRKLPQYSSKMAQIAEQQGRGQRCLLAPTILNGIGQELSQQAHWAPQRHTVTGDKTTLKPTRNRPYGNSQTWSTLGHRPNIF